MNLTIMQIAWLVYAACGIGLCLAAWWMFLWAWRFVRYSAVVTVMVLFFTPYAIDAQTMQMAPAIYSLLFNGMALGLDGILPLIKLMLGIWSIGIVLIAVFVLLTRKSVHYHYTEPADSRTANSRKASGRSLSDRNAAGRNSGERAPAGRNQDSRRVAQSSVAQSSVASSSKKKPPAKPPASARKDYFSSDNLSREERQARDEMLQGDVPMRAIRD